MSKEWYPEIDMELCKNCNRCLEVCTSSVFENTNGKVIVMYPEDCIIHCTICQINCPEKAIYYVLEL